MRRDYLNNADINNIQYRNPEKFLPSQDIYCGAKCVFFLSKTDISENDKNEFRRNRLNFLVESAHQIYKRSCNSEHIQGLKQTIFLV